MSFSQRPEKRRKLLHDEWEVFKGGPSVPKAERVNITLNPRKRLMMNANVHKRWGSPEAAIMMFNEYRSLIALVPCEPDVPIGFPIRYSRKYYEIATAPFCRAYGIEIAATLRFNDPVIDKNNHLILDLRDTTIVKRNFRNRE